MSDEYIKKEDALEALDDALAEFIPSFWGRSEVIPLRCAIAINKLSTYSIPDSAKIPKNGERFSCPNCGFKADWYIPNSADIEKIKAEIKQFREDLAEKSPSLQDLINSQRTVDICLGIIDKYKGE